MTSTHPQFVPPNWVFGPVWVTLFTLMGVVVWLTLRYDHPRRKWTPAVSVGHPTVNVAWSAAFLGPWLPAVGLAVIVILLAAILVTTCEFTAISRRVAALLVPYLPWACLAAALNYGFWLPN